MEVCDQTQVLQANRKAAELRSTLPHALSARYDGRIKRVLILLSNRLEVAFSPHDAEGLEKATSQQLDLIEISPSGFGIYFPKLDADLYLPGLLEGAFASRKWIANHAQTEDAFIASAAKVSAARQNNRTGGKSKKTASVTEFPAPRRLPPARRRVSNESVEDIPAFKL